MATPTLHSPVRVEPFGPSRGQNGRFKPHAVRDGHLITGQQQYSGVAATRLLIDALGT
jgi:hypothetical protein